MSDTDKLLRRAQSLIDGEYYSASDTCEIVKDLACALIDMENDRNRYEAMWRAVLTDFVALRGF